MKAYAYAALAAAALALVAYAAHSLYSAGREAGTAACEAVHARAAEAARTEETRRETAGAVAHTDMLAYLAANLPATEIRTHETVERIRSVYRDHPACTEPAGVLAALDEARRRANAAAGVL